LKDIPDSAKRTFPYTAKIVQHQNLGICMTACFNHTHMIALIVIIVA